MKTVYIVTFIVLGALAGLLSVIMAIFGGQMRSTSVAHLVGNEVQIEMSWKSNDMIKTTGATTRIAFIADPSGPQVRKVEACKVAGDERIGGWIETDRTLNWADLYVYIDHGTFQIPHPCNGRVRIRRR